MAEQTKANKDRRQAAGVLEVLLEDRPADLQPAWEALKQRGNMAETALLSSSRLSQEIQAGLESLGPP